MAMESGSYSKGKYDSLERSRRETIEEDTPFIGIPPEDVVKLSSSPIEDGEQGPRSIEGTVRGVAVKAINDPTNGLEVTLDDKTLNAEDAKDVYGRLAWALRKRDRANIEHIDAVYETAVRENEKYPEDVYNREVRPVLAKFLGKEA